MSRIRQRRRRSSAFLTESEVRAAHVLYLGGASLRQLGALFWERFGYASPETAARNIGVAFQFHNLPRRTISQAKALEPKPQRVRHRPGQWHREGYCQGTVTNYPRKGHPCARRVKRGERYCAKHAPQKAAQVAALAQAARAARSPQP